MEILLMLNKAEDFVFSKVANQKWFAVLATVLPVISIITFLNALYLLDFYRLILTMLLGAASYILWDLGHKARVKERDEQQLLQTYKKRHGEWLTNPKTVKRIISALQKCPTGEVEDFYRDLQYKMHPLIKELGAGYVRTGFLEVSEACLKITRPELDPKGATARQLALKEFESFKQEK